MIYNLYYIYFTITLSLNSCCLCDSLGPYLTLSQEAKWFFYSYSKLKRWKKRNIEHESPQLTFLSLCPVLTINEHVSINQVLLLSKQWTNHQRGNWQHCISFSQTLTIIFNYWFQSETQNHKEKNNPLLKGSKFFKGQYSRGGCLPFTLGLWNIVEIDWLIYTRTCSCT